MKKMLFTVIMVLMCTNWMSAQTKTVADKELIGAWTLEWMQYDGEKKIDCGLYSVPTVNVFGNGRCSPPPWQELISQNSPSTPSNPSVPSLPSMLVLKCPMLTDDGQPVARSIFHMTDDLSLDAERAGDVDYGRRIGGIDVDFHAMPHVEHLVHFAPVGAALLLTTAEPTRYNY